MDNNFHSSQKRTISLHIAYFLLYIGFAMFVGCIMCCIVMNAIINVNPTVTSFYYERLFETQMVYVLTIPGMWMMSASGLFLVFKNKEGFFRRNRAGLIQILSIMILINGTFILTPLVRKVTFLANEGMQKGNILPQFTVLKGREDMFGAINFALLLICLFLAVFKPFESKSGTAALPNFMKVKEFQGLSDRSQL